VVDFTYTVVALVPATYGVVQAASVNRFVAGVQVYVLKSASVEVTVIMPAELLQRVWLPVIVKAGGGVIVATTGLRGLEQEVVPMRIIIGREE